MFFYWLRIGFLRNFVYSKFRIFCMFSFIFRILYESAGYVPMFWPRSVAEGGRKLIFLTPTGIFRRYCHVSKEEMCPIITLGFMQDC
jgi:hypothetical protein